MNAAIHSEDTIIAIASAAGGAYRGIIRLSGNRVVESLAPLFAASDGVELTGFRSPQTIRGQIATKEFSQTIPCDICIWPTNKSFTRQPTAEIHTIGCPAILDAIVRGVCARGARLAAPGEFTLRAFLAGRIDLTQAEAVLGVIDATGDRALQTALSQLAGGLSAPLQQIRDCLLDLLAHLEAGLDFVEEDIEFISQDELIAQLSTAATKVRELLAQIQNRSVSDAQPRVVLMGLPNAGKSSLFNALLPSEKAIVSPLEGTTRDFVTAHAEFDGVVLQLVDTAGVEEVDGDSIAGRSQVAMDEQTRNADLRVCCVDASREIDPENPYLKKILANADLVAFTKIENQIDGFRVWAREGIPTVATSAHQRTGLDSLQKEIGGMLSNQESQSDGAVAATATRCRDSLEQTEKQLKRAIHAAQLQLGEELVAAETRVALTHLAHVVGAIYTDDILDRVFSRFCIGK